MKKMIRFICLLCALPMLFAACAQSGATTGGAEPTGERLIPAHELDSKEIEAGVASQIKRAYLDETGGRQAVTATDLYISPYYGNYSGCEVFKIGGDGLQYTQALREVKVAGMTLVFPDGQPVWVFKYGCFYSIKDAYNAGLITQNDVYEIAKKACVQE